MSACGTSTYTLAKFLTKILQLHGGNSFSFVKDNKGLVKYLKQQKVAPDETLVSFKVSAFFSNIPVPVSLVIINRTFREHKNQTGTEKILEKNLTSYPKTKLSLFLN